VATTVKPVRCRNVRGVLLKVELTDRGEFVTPGSVLEQRLVMAQNQQVFVRKFVSQAAGERNPRLYDLLDNEIRAGTRLGQVFGDRYPPELARLAAYNMDAEEPFVLLHEYLGEPARGRAIRLDDAQRRLFQVSLWRALQLTAAAGVVHGAVDLKAVRWDGRQLQLVDFESAERAGEPRRGGHGEVDVRDDMWGAGRLVRILFLGALADGSRLDRSHDPQLLRTLLDPVFDNPVERRPYPADLLRSLRASGSVPPLSDPEAGLAAGRELFDQVSAGKPQPAVVDRAPPDDARSGRWGLRILPFLAAMIVVATVIVGMVVLV
jgi:hypothetical protein